jgi:hypothetical protein
MYVFPINKQFPESATKIANQRETPSKLAKQKQKICYSKKTRHRILTSLLVIICQDYHQ